MSASLSLSSTIKLSSGHAIPVIGFGVYHGNGEAVAHALRAGYRLIDTADFYNNEGDCGKAVRDFMAETGTPRSAIFYTTKLWNNNHGYTLTAKAIDEAIARAGIDYIDLYLIHSPLTSSELRLGSWKAMQDAVDAGKIKSIGVSNYGVHHLEELFTWDGFRIPPAVNQVELHPWLARKDLVDYCRSKGILMEAYCPVTRGVRFGEPAVVELAAKHGVTPAQVLIRWSMQMGFVPLPKSNHEERIKVNLDVFGFDLDEDDMHKLDTGKYEPVAAWDPVTAPL
ncbi:NADP-dependent oxidoreductase domain-containing protein [Myxozyma melibiosi]|uniref:NADP-dependent oxidoreductase domain-containing protein n=1 Tax=Myxozyma melibiosi TaxID=54550 RepID=A0ABR1F6V9_9ASCO